MIKVLVVDDSRFMRTMIKDLLNETKKINVVDEAKDGEEALSKIQNDVDVVLLDIEMPKKTGIEVLEDLQSKKNYIPVIMFSSLTKEGSRETIRALELGAFDFIEKPSTILQLPKIKQEIISKIEAAFQYSKRSKPLFKNKNIILNRNQGTSQHLKNVILIGCSTGGPRALKEMLPMFPKETNASFLIVQHMPKGNYINSLADTLNRCSKLNVQVAKDKQEMKHGNVYIVPSGYQGNVGKGGKIEIRDYGPDSGHNPSVNFLFRESLKNKDLLNLIPVVLTGMGGDGSDGALLFSKHGIETIVESENTSVVFGMPRQVIEKGAKHKILDLLDIPEYIIARLK